MNRFAGGPKAMGKAETASRNKNASGAADSGESRDGGTRAVSFSDHWQFALCALTLIFCALVSTGAQRAPATGKFRTHGEALLNNLELTPGAVRSIDRKSVCEGGSTKQFRHTTEAMKRKVYAAYGVDKHKALAFSPSDDAEPPLYEIDHLISLELGGDDAVENLWPQPYYMHPGAHEKDALENWAHKQVCAGKIELQEAQRRIATDWYQFYLDEHLEKKGGAKPEPDNSEYAKGAEPRWVQDTEEYGHWDCPQGFHEPEIHFAGWSCVADPSDDKEAR